MFSLACKRKEYAIGPGVSDASESLMLGDFCETPLLRRVEADASQERQTTGVGQTNFACPVLPRKINSLSGSGYSYLLGVQFGLNKSNSGRCLDCHHGRTVTALV